jgi:hypothetical protein
MTRWSAQGVAVAGWFAAAVVISSALPEHQSLLLAPRGFAINFIFICGPVSAGASVATTLLVAIWRSMSPRAVALVHGVMGVACLVALMISLGW